MPTRPEDPIHTQADNTLHGGLTIREHFASLVLAGMARRFGHPAKTADVAVQMADALIARLNNDPAKSQGPAADVVIDLR